MKYNNVTIKGVGSSLPSKIITNKDLEKTSPTSDEWIFNSLGIKERRSVNDELVSDLGVKAALKALKNANIDKEDIDLIVVATSSPEKISPSTACTIHKKLKIKKDIPSFDLNAVCAGFVFAFGLSAPLISNGTYKNILIIGTETYSRITDYTHRNCVFFGDGAGAIVLSYSNKGWASVELKSNGSGTGSTGFTCPLEGKYNTIPKEVKDQAIKVLPNSIKSILSKNKLNPSELSMFIPHQASINVLKSIASKVGINPNKLKSVMHKYGNIAGASIPIALDDALKNNEIKKGDKILLTAIGSGWSWGSILLNYDD
jgi:3-oxoacyl-[acyl-carrier-protein] synthase-3